MLNNSYYEGQQEMLEGKRKADGDQEAEHRDSQCEPAEFEEGGRMLRESMMNHSIVVNDMDEFELI